MSDIVKYVYQRKTNKYGKVRHQSLMSALNNLNCLQSYETQVLLQL